MFKAKMIKQQPGDLYTPFKIPFGRLGLNAEDPPHSMPPPPSMSAPELKAPAKLPPLDKPPPLPPLQKGSGFSNPKIETYQYIEQGLHPSNQSAKTQANPPGINAAN